MKRLITSLNEVTSIADNRFHGFFDEPPRIEFSLRELTKTHLNQNVFDYHLQNKLLGFKTFSFCDTEKVRNGMGYPEDPDISVELTEIHKFCCYRGIDFELFAIIVGFYGLAEYLTLKLSPDYSIWHDQFLKLMMTYYMLKDDKSLIKTLTDFIENHVTHIRDEEKVLSPFNFFFINT